MKWISNSIDESRTLKDHYKLHSIDIIIKEQVPENVDIDFVIKYIAARVPEYLISGIDIIYVGQFDFLIVKGVNALYEDGAIYLTNDQTDEMDMIDDIVHEIAHAVENSFVELVYGDGKLEIEFYNKRNQLYAVLDNVGITPPPQFIVTTSYDKGVDDFLYKQVGYTALWNYVVGIFPSPYAATSLREYFARGFEEYYIGDRKSLTKSNIVLYSKLQELADLEE
jgi:hypothetical protein